MRLKFDYDRPKRILFVANGWPFLLSYRRHLIELLLSRKWEVHAAAPGQPPALMPARCITHELKLSRESRNLATEIGTGLDVVRLLRGVRPDVVEASTIKAVVYTAIAARWVRTRRVVLWYAGLGVSSPSTPNTTPILGRAVQWTIQAIPAKKGWTFVAENAADVEFLRKGPVGRVRDVRMIRGRGVNLQAFMPTSAEPKVFDVVFAGRFLKSKGVVAFVQAVQEMKAKLPSLRAALAGSTDPGNPDSVDDQQVYDWRAEGLVETVGQVADMPSLLAKTRLLCFPSTYGEGAPRIVMEAASAGVPVVCVKSATVVGLVEDGVTGVVVASPEPSQISHACMQLLKNEDMRASMGSAAAEYARRHFGAEQALVQTLDLYTQSQSD